MPGGRPRKPQELKKIEGTYRKDRDNENRPEFERITRLPDCPSYLTTNEAQALWNDVCQQLMRLKILQIVDLPMLAAYCQEMGKYFFYQTYLAKKGEYYESGGKIMARPQVKAAKEALQEAQKLAGKFGFTPADREKINVLLSIQANNNSKKEEPKDKGEFVWG